MSDTPEVAYAFVAQACPEARFKVVQFEGEEGLSRCYRFRIELACEREDLDLGRIMGSPVSFTILRPDRDGRPELPFHGRLLEFSQLRQVGPLAFYEAILVPRLHLLSLTRHNQVFLDQTLPEFISACLKDGGLEDRDFRFVLAGDPAAWPKWDYLCQFGESHLDFVQRWLEREGLYYFFEQRDGRDQVVITDSRIVHQGRPGEAAVRYHPDSGLAYRHRGEVVAEFFCRRSLVPEKVATKDYNYLTPATELKGEAGVSDHGHGTVYRYGGHFRTPEEGRRLAELQAEEARCREVRFEGRGSVPFLQPGCLFRLQGHYRKDCDGDYLTLSIRHQGRQPGFLLAGLGQDLAGAEREPDYRNSFSALPAQVQFRPPVVTPKPRIGGVIPARVDAEGEQVLMDSMSRYKVILPFDESGKGGGKASAWVRMLTAYAGAGCGFNAPLHKGTEVLLSFIDGDPDRPVIAGAVPNPQTPSPVNGDNPTQVILQTLGGNRLVLDDQAGRESIAMYSPNGESRLRVGAPSDLAGDGEGSSGQKPPGDEGDNGLLIQTNSDLTVNCTNLTETIAGKARTDIQGGNITTINGYNIFNVLGGHLSNVTGGTTNFTQGAFVSLNIFGNYTYSFPEFLDFSPSHSAIKNHGKAINQIVTEVSDIKTEMANSAKQDIKDSMISNVSHVHFIDTAKKVAKMEQENVTVKVTENNEWTLRTKELNVESDATTINIKGLKGSITTSFLETKRLQLSTEERQELTNRASLVGKWNFI